MNILINLPPTFFEVPSATSVLDRLGEARRTSHNSADEIREDLAWAEIVLMWSWPALNDELLDAAPHLKMAAHLDLGQAAARTAIRRGLPTSVARSAFSPAVAEYALGLILAGLRRFSDAHADMRENRETWVKAFPGDIPPLERELSGRPVGIVGFGRVGRRLRELLAPFGGPVTVVDPFIDEATASLLNVRRAEMAEMLKTCDVVVLSAASNADSAHLLGAQEIAMLHPNAVLVNVARAALVDTDALVARLRRGDLVAAIDVFDQEPLGADHPLRTCPNCLLTPHRAGGTLTSVERILTMLVDDIEAFLSGRALYYPLVEAMIPSLDG